VVVGGSWQQTITTLENERIMLVFEGVAVGGGDGGLVRACTVIKECH